MQNVQVFHVPNSKPTVIPDADFRTDPGGEFLTVYRGDEVLAQFPAGKWSAAIKTDAPATVTQ